MKALKKKDGMFWWVAPTYGLANKGWKILLRDVSRNAFTKILHSYPKTVELVSGSTIEFLSAHDPDSIIGEGLDGLVLDECARVSETAWVNSLRPTLTDKLGWALRISTPVGLNWWYKEHQKGKGLFVPTKKRVIRYRESWSFPTSANPYISKQEILDAKDDLPIDVYRQEFLAEFLSDASGVFRNINKVIAGDLREPQKDITYYLGVDLAKKRDFTVLTIMDEHFHLCYFERFNQIDYTYQKKKIVEVANRYNDAIVNIDSTGVGEPIFDDLAYELRIKPYHFTNESKKDLIQNLVLAFEKQILTLPDIPVLLEELRMFVYELTKSGKIRYTAPEGFHDDCVISLALSFWEASHRLDLTQGGETIADLVY